MYPQKSYVRKFGENPEVDTGTVPEDVWDVGGVYVFPSAAAATTIVSAEAADDIAGTGARTVLVQGQIAGNVQASETVEMDGTDAVTLTNQFLRIYRAKVVTSGSGETNAGNIQIKHGATVIGQITAGEGQTLMAIWTVPEWPSGFSGAYLLGWRASVLRVQATVAVVVLQIREPGGSWQTKDKDSVSNTSRLCREFKEPEFYEAGTDVRVRVTEVSANDAKIFAGFDFSIV